LATSSAPTYGCPSPYMTYSNLTSYAFNQYKQDTVTWNQCTKTWTTYESFTQTAINPAGDQNHTYIFSCHSKDDPDASMLIACGDFKSDDPALVPASWQGDHFCDDALNCAAYKYDDGDCLVSSTGAAVGGSGASYDPLVCAYEDSSHLYSRSVLESSDCSTDNYAAKEAQVLCGCSCDSIAECSDVCDYKKLGDKAPLLGACLYGLQNMDYCNDNIEWKGKLAQVLAFCKGTNSASTLSIQLPLVAVISAVLAFL